MVEAVLGMVQFEGEEDTVLLPTAGMNSVVVVEAEEAVTQEDLA